MSNPAEITAVITAAAGLVTAVTALIKVLQHVRSHKAGGPVSLPHADTERAEQRDVPMGFSPPDCRA